MSESATKIAGFIPVSKDFMVDSLPLRTMTWSTEDRITEYLKYGRSVTTGAHLFNPADVGEAVEWVEWDDEDWLPYLDWPEWATYE